MRNLKIAKIDKKDSVNASPCNKNLSIYLIKKGFLYFIILLILSLISNANLSNS